MRIRSAAALGSVLGILGCLLLLAALAVELSNGMGSVSNSTPVAITRLTHESSTDIRPAWSPDNRLIAFESNRDGGKFHIYVMKPDGSSVRALTGGMSEDRRPVWTPDGRAILFDSFDGTHQNIWSVDVTSGSRKQLTNVDGLADFGVLSPNGERLAFYLYKDMTLNLWTARADGKDARALTSDLADARKNQPTISWHQAAWSPDNEWLAFTGGDGRSIWVMRSDGSEKRCVVDDGETNHFPWFLPDGRLGFITEYVPPRYGGAWTNAWAYDLKTGERTLLQEFMSMQGPVDWSADLSKIVFFSPRAGNFEIYLIDMNAPNGLSALRGTPVPTEPAPGE